MEAREARIRNTHFSNWPEDSSVLAMHKANVATRESAEGPPSKLRSHGASPINDDEVHLMMSQVSASFCNRLEASCEYPHLD